MSRQFVSIGPTQVAVAIAAAAVATTTALLYWWNQRSSSQETTSRGIVNASDKTVLMDSPDLDQRILRKAEAVIQGRTSRITVVVERCTNDHNYSAILRTAEALGIQHVWIISPPETETVEDDTLRRSTGQVVKRATAQEIQGRALHHLFAQNATEWLTLREFDNTQDCIRALRDTQHTIWVTDLGQEAVCLTSEGLLSCPQQPLAKGFPNKVAIVMGTEAVGCSKTILEAADLRVYLPLRGFADSLNLSVATALVLQQLFVLEPALAGAMSEEERRALRQEWFPKLCQQRLLTSSQKKRRNKILGQIRAAQAIQAKQESNAELQTAELNKLNKLPALQQELNELEAETGYHDSQKAIQAFIDNPPAPLTDLRRCDEHRDCYVGKNTRKRNEENWKGMPATTGHTTNSQSSSFFRSLLQSTR